MKYTGDAHGIPRPVWFMRGDPAAAACRGGGRGANKSSVAKPSWGEFGESPKARRAVHDPKGQEFLCTSLETNQCRPVPPTSRGGEMGGMGDVYGAQ